MPTREPSASAQLAKSLSRFPTDITALAKRCLPKLRRALPGCHQLVYDYAASLVVSFGSTDRGHEATVALAVANERRRHTANKPTDSHGLATAKIDELFSSQEDAQQGCQVTTTDHF